MHKGCRERFFDRGLLRDAPAELERGVRGCSGLVVEDVEFEFAESGAALWRARIGGTADCDSGDQCVESPECDDAASGGRMDEVGRGAKVGGVRFGGVLNGLCGAGKAGGSETCPYGSRKQLAPSCAA